jgi:chromosome segregation protein
MQAVLADWLHGAWVVPTLADALAARDHLAAGQMLVVPEGHLVSRHAVQLYAPDNAQAGLLARAQEIDNLDKALKAQALIVEQLRGAVVRADAAATQHTEQSVQAQRQATSTQQAAHSLQMQRLQLQQQADALRLRGHQLDADLADVQATAAELAQRQAEAEARFETLDAQLAQAQETHAELEEHVFGAQRRLDADREQRRSLERQAQEAQFGLRALQARGDELRRSQATAATQIEGLDSEAQQLQAELERLSDTVAQTGLQAALDLKLERERLLGERRSVYEDLSARLRSTDERRLSLERELEPLRQRITDLRLKEQAAQLGVEQYTQQLVDAQAALDDVQASIETDQIKLAGLSAEIDRLQRDIVALGAVNLAALDELTAARERKAFLDAQTVDLSSAMQTLEDAIKKIDGETRDLLGHTFSSVNEHFGRMFPELFGGGQAKLVMTGDEILDSGVQVMAQPPGKKNQTIALLSGGEKALTAIALVFAIFQLNPAPFCLLDEVDAPLDDANTDRYARLVRKMSSGTQFLFISHNKIAMEMAEQLIGVTMQEQGVSRIVAVDMDSAARLVQTP